MPPGLPARPSDRGLADFRRAVIVVSPRLCYAAGAKRWPSAPEFAYTRWRAEPTTTRDSVQTCTSGCFRWYWFRPACHQSQITNVTFRVVMVVSAPQPTGHTPHGSVYSLRRSWKLGQHETTIGVPNRLLRLTEFRFNLGYGRDTLLKLVNLSLIDLDSARLGCVRSRCCGCCDYVGYDTARQEQSAAKQGDWQDNGMPTHLLLPSQNLEHCVIDIM